MNLQRIGEDTRWMPSINIRKNFRFIFDGVTVNVPDFSSPALLGCGVQDLPCILAVADVHAAETAASGMCRTKQFFYCMYIPSHQTCHCVWFGQTKFFMGSFYIIPRRLLHIGYFCGSWHFMALAFQQPMRHDVIMSKLKFNEKQFKVQVGETCKKVVILITRRLLCEQSIFRLLYICEWVRYQPSRTILCRQDDVSTITNFLYSKLRHFQIACNS